MKDPLPYFQKEGDFTFIFDIPYKTFLRIKYTS